MPPHKRVPVDVLLSGLRAAGEATRLRLLVLLAAGELTVKEITEILGLSQPRVSRHLKLLVEAGLVDRFQEGSWAFYRLADHGMVAPLARRLVDIIDQEEVALARDRERADAVRQRRAAAALDYFRIQAPVWDRVRALHIDETLVEHAMIEATEGMDIRTVLDLGTGTGRVLELFADKARHLIGIDVSHAMLNMARAKLDGAGLTHAQVRQGDIYQLTFDEASFDLVTIHQVLHFLDDPARAVREAARMLAPGGMMVIVDFAPHEVEFLREDHAHRRLGFANQEVTAWLAAADLGRVVHRDLSPKPGHADQLTVSLWTAIRCSKAAGPSGALAPDEKIRKEPIP